MMGFDSLGDFATYITRTLLRQMPHAMHDASEQVGQMLEDAAKAKLGTYQDGWPPLSEETIKRKTTSGDSPLLETGELRDSIHHVVVTHPGTGASDIYVGSDDDKALWHELGTSTIPPRPFLSTTAQELAPTAANLIGARVTAFLQTGQVTTAKTEYDRHKDIFHGLPPLE